MLTAAVVLALCLMDWRGEIKLFHFLDISSFANPVKMSEQMEEKIKNYRTAPFDARFPNTNQTRNCFQNYLGKGEVLSKKQIDNSLIP